MKRLLAIIFLVTMNSLSFAGEWQTGGNAPVPPYYPKTPANYQCTMTIITGVSTKQYRIDHEINFHDADFQLPGYGAARYSIKGEKDPGMNGQSMSLSFHPNAEGTESVSLYVFANIQLPDKSIISATGEAQRPRAEDVITASTRVSIRKPSKKKYFKGLKSVDLRVTCYQVPATF